MMQLGDVFIGNPVGLYALLSLVPLILLYLMQPKPQNKVIPSLMFFFKEKGYDRQSSFLRKLLRNLLLFMQLLVLLLLAFSLAQPYISVPKGVAIGDVVLVIDVSASSQSSVGSSTRFDKIISEAKNNLGGTNTIILAQNIPLVVLEEEGSGKAAETLSAIKPKGTNSNIGDAMLLAGDILGETHGRIVVISDFAYNAGPDPLVAKRSLTADGYEVKLVSVGEEAGNVAITNLLIDKFNTKVYIKNFNDAEKTVEVDVINNNAKVGTMSKTISPESVETFTMETLPGITEVVVKSDDAVELDDHAFISSPFDRKIRVLLVTNLDSSYIQSALRASKDIELAVAKPPVTPSVDYDVIVFSRFSKELLLPGFFTDAERKLKNGTKIIVVAQPDLDKVNIPFLPVSISGAGGASAVNVDITNQFTKDIEFGSVSKYLKASADNSSVVVASAAADSSPLIVLKDFGSGQVVYYGIMDDAADFKNSITYPIFWSELINFLMRSEDINDFNFKTDKIMPIENQVVKTPSGTVETTKLLLDEVGIYQIGNKKIAANLLNEKESDVRKVVDVAAENSAFMVEPSKEAGKKNLDYILVCLAFAMVALELLYIKKRGDI